ncbi:MAG: RidA family protein [Proteiniphilum sp.]|jgi:2-iminobutanoate/2-iminopropanoate deaminase|nr:RidA family protein [Proteiniphilum sp.]
MKKVISTNNAPAAIGPYSQAVEANGMLFLSGMLPIDPSTGNIVPGGVKEQTTQIFDNIKAVLAAAGVSTDNIVKTTVFLEDMSLFGAMNEVYATRFTGTFPARSAFAVKALPKNALVEIEVIAVLSPAVKIG